MKSAKTKQLWKNVILYVVKILVALIMFLPIIWIITGGFKTLTEFTTSSNIVPKKVTFENFIYIFKNSNIWLYTRNTVLLMGGTTAGTLISSSLVAYPLARMEFRGKNLIFSIIIATMMIPNIALIIPQYIMFGKLGWLDSLFPMIIPAFFAYPYNVFLFRQYFRSIPKELDESATIDGCNKMQIFFKVLAPLSKPTYATIAVLSCVFWWNELTQPVFYINSDQWRTLTIALMTSYMYTSGNAFVINWPSIMAAATLMIVPPMVLYFCGNQFLVGGIKTSGLKG
ncbi:Inner membrane ABC transporter permease protein ycjP [uncultured Clostridium sp.]|uniref:Carbohydrate ABC transporter permease n=1 Tax=Muricoprocola aceti TaxID=2981772 RepID=A0ABT2SMA3_9FIRM|nr:carbohydrate ABC transporter permease [Muricoprocola aceti]MCU6725629.1 carbohydrate ABC transporter permease [Muricoprocola aceti]SCH57962.1 Inner membrane ABC transporter permease protein ycjP [uncultured Clostridium sp.]